MGIPNSEFIISEESRFPKFIFNIADRHDVERGVFWSKFFEEHAEYIEKAFNDILSRANA